MCVCERETDRLHMCVYVKASEAGSPGMFVCIVCAYGLCVCLYALRCNRTCVWERVYCALLSIFGFWVRFRLSLYIVLYAMPRYCAYAEEEL